MTKRKKKTEAKACAVKTASGFAQTTPCSECPWRKDVAPGRFPPERYIALRRTAQQGFGNPIFACHKTTEGRDNACVGFLLVEGDQNFQVRMAVITGRLDYGKLKSPYPLYESYAELAAANGVEQDD